MQEHSRYAVGIDVGTKMVRCVIGHIDAETGVTKIIGVGEVPNSGMRKGMVSHLTGPAAAIDKVLELVERMSGHQVNDATISVNGTHILSTKANGMIAVGTNDTEVTEDDVARLEEMATTGKVPANREILEIVPYSYRLDGQDIKDPVGMTGARMELRANVVSALKPYVAHLRKSAEMAKVAMTSVVPSVLASARAVLTESQLENGVAVIDIGGATTGVAVFEEGDLQHVAVIPMGAQNVTNDLAIGLKTDPEVAEQVKLTHARFGQTTPGEVETKYEKQTYLFEQTDIDEIVEARYEEIFELIAKELEKAGGIGHLPSGVVLVGGGARIEGLVPFAKTHLRLAAKLGVPRGYSGASDGVERPEFAAAVGLMLIDGSGAHEMPGGEPLLKKSNEITKKAGGLLQKLLAKFK